MKKHILTFILVLTSVSAQITVKTAHGSLVDLVSVYKTSPEGFYYSVKPDGATVGSKTLQIQFAKWIQIDTKSIIEYEDFYNSISSPVPVVLNIGPHFTDFSAKKSEILARIVEKTGPKSYVFEKITDKDFYNRIPINRIHAQRAVGILKEEYENLKIIDYLPEAIKFRSILKKCVKTFEHYADGKRVFSIDGANDVLEFLAY